MKTLVIVESPAKCQKINSFLGSNYIVMASYGHIRDLEKGTKAIDINNNFKPIYRLLPSKLKVINNLKRAAKKVNEVIIASDLDREGEAIGYHIAKVLNLDLKKTKRIVFNQITKNAVLKALQNPKRIDMNLFNSQQARRILDRLVGFGISPTLWRHIQTHLSAGRCQSPALRLVYDREQQICNFSSTCYFETTGIFYENNTKYKLEGILNKKYNTDNEILSLLNDCKTSKLSILRKKKSNGSNKPSAPFTTSSLQQEASNKIGLSPRSTMSIAQKLYEAGKITYMRTDSVYLSNESMGMIKSYILSKYGDNYYEPKAYKTKTQASQEAHEAIRPVYINEPVLKGNFSSSEKRLYKLIHDRTIASQMKPSLKDIYTILVGISKRKDYFTCKIEKITFLGYLVVYNMKISPVDKQLEKLEVGNLVTYNEIISKQKYTKSSNRYTEASLVKELEKKGIGRPSTFSNLISTIQDRKYVIKDTREGKDVEIKVFILKNNKINELSETIKLGTERNKLFITDVGRVVTEFLIQHFKNILDYGFTSSIENELDKIAKGNKKWHSLVDIVYKTFHPNVLKLTNNKTSIEKYDNKKLLGKHQNKNIYTYIGKYGPVIQFNDSETYSENRFCAVPKEISIKDITLEQAVKLLIYPKNLGNYKGKPVLLKKGPYGFYIKYNDQNISLKDIPEDKIPCLTLQKAMPLIRNAKKPIIKQLTDDICIRNGPYGPYIKCNNINVAIPKDINPEDLDCKQCKKLIEDKKKNGWGRGRKKNTKTTTRKPTRTTTRTPTRTTTRTTTRTPTRKPTKKKTKK